nr:Chain B, p53 peptide [synthetic construct]
GARAHSS